MSAGTEVRLPNGCSPGSRTTHTPGSTTAALRLHNGCTLGPRSLDVWSWALQYSRTAGRTASVGGHDLARTGERLRSSSNRNTFQTRILYTVPMRLTFQCLLFIFMLSLPERASAWNATGHQLVARIAWNAMTPAVRQRVIALLEAAPGDACLRELLPGGVGCDGPRASDRPVRSGPARQQRRRPAPAAEGVRGLHHASMRYHDRRARDRARLDPAPGR